MDRAPRQERAGHGPRRRRDPGRHRRKWEVDKTTGWVRWELEDGEPRVAKFLPYPANYGMVPSTLLAKDDGGAGDPLDVLLLGPAVARGTVVSARLLGVLRLRDGGEIDDKLIAVPDGSSRARDFFGFRVTPSTPRTWLRRGVQEP